MNPTTITVGECRLSYCNVFQPQPPFNNPAGEKKFSVTVLVPKSNPAAKAAIDAAINAAIEELRADGTLKELSEKYFGQDISAEN